MKKLVIKKIIIPLSLCAMSFVQGAAAAEPKTSVGGVAARAKTGVSSAAQMVSVFITNQKGGEKGKRLEMEINPVFPIKTNLTLIWEILHREYLGKIYFWYRGKAYADYPRLVVNRPSGSYLVGLSKEEQETLPFKIMIELGRTATSRGISGTKRGRAATTEAAAPPTLAQRLRVDSVDPESAAAAAAHSMSGEPTGSVDGALGLLAAVAGAEKELDEKLSTSLVFDGFPQGSFTCGEDMARTLIYEMIKRYGCFYDLRSLTLVYPSRYKIIITSIGETNEGFSLGIENVFKEHGLPGSVEVLSKTRLPKLEYGVTETSIITREGAHLRLRGADHTIIHLLTVLLNYFPSASAMSSGVIIDYGLRVSEGSFSPLFFRAKDMTEALKVLMDYPYLPAQIFMGFNDTYDFVAAIVSHFATYGRGAHVYLNYMTMDGSFKATDACSALKIFTEHLGFPFELRFCLGGV